MANVLSLKNVSKKFGAVFAVSDISFSVEKGEIIGFVGSNGAGKSTTINIILGFLNPSEGEVRIFGEAISPNTAHVSHKRIGFASGDMALFDNLTGQQYLDFLANQYNGSHQRDKLIKDLGPDLHKKIKHLSRGNKQKIALIGALQHSPDLILLDEPTSGLDPLMQRKFVELISQQKERGATVLMSSHILSEVAELATRVICLKQGSVVLDSPAQDIETGTQKTVSLILNPQAIKQIRSKGLPKESSSPITDKSTMTFTYNGGTQALIAWLATIKPTDVTISNESLDEIFADLYQRDRDENA